MAESRHFGHHVAQSTNQKQLTLSRERERERERDSKHHHEDETVPKRREGTFAVNIVRQRLHAGWKSVQVRLQQAISPSERQRPAVCTDKRVWMTGRRYCLCAGLAEMRRTRCDRSCKVLSGGCARHDRLCVRQSLSTGQAPAHQEYRACKDAPSRLKYVYPLSRNPRETSLSTSSRMTFSLTAARRKCAGTLSQAC